MLLTIDDLRATLDRLESDGHTHLVAFWRTIPDAKDAASVPDTVTHDQMLDIIDPGCGDFNRVHEEIDAAIADAGFASEYYNEDSDCDLDTDYNNFDPIEDDDDFFVGDDDHA